MVIEKRQSPRANIFCKITTIFGERLLVLNSYTENISEGGVKVILEEKLHVSTEVDLELSLSNGKAPIKCKGQVIWSNEIKSDEAERNYIFDTGIKFTQISQEDKNSVNELVRRLVKEQGNNE